MGTRLPVTATSSSPTRRRLVSLSIGLVSDFLSIIGVELRNILALAFSSYSENSGSRIEGEVGNWLLG